MNKAELVAEVAKLADLNKKQADAAVAAVIDAVTYALKKGEKVQLVGFGSFEAKERAARMGRNPKTKEEIKIPATKVATFKAGKALKDAVAD
ncbi:MAG: HU family DNA-binding protein [Oscillospiraceae bacterium]|jgi:DNA-binding protein HU-beta|nr:HU family DNA-binding protein [Oscillospiraceae bacterium]MBQ1642505.1 HU family DNA-binding protein [Oscillospiraceae bacterium]MBQ2145406.1 HU family DNA-binding protein [Oscillospiraceae bacterium]MBQ5489898.1 HU family DNA-binding protein [Oscillospiraceae bacterium]MBQ6048364.1 HU family DNA-binding protein [Oscillospiraceae bacterium]